MTDYKTYSRDAFIALRDKFKADGFAFYNPNENLVIYANRLGITYVWRNDAEKNVITIREVRFTIPSALTCEDFDWLKKIAKKKHWRGGVEKLHYYKHHVVGDVLDEQGIDPYFYAWMAEHDYAPEQEKGYYNGILTPTQYDGVCEYARLNCKDVEQLIQSCATAIQNGVTFNGWLEDRYKYQDITTLRAKVSTFVNEILPSNFDALARQDTIDQVFVVMKRALKDYL
ncbi:MAG: hypothetical protein II453_17320 [Alphaproteobacteria bacterium]|nr:hypothetical protein [Alphaproteobacteria bacterium]